MEKVSNCFDVKYCALCFEPLDDDFDGVCPECGQKTTALNVNERLKLDDTVDEKYRNAPKKAAAIFGAASVIQLVLIIILLIAGFMSSSAVQAKNAAVETYSDTESDTTNYVEKALKFDTHAEFLDDCEPLAYEEDFYRFIWTSSVDIRAGRVNRRETPQDPLPITETNPRKGGITLADIGSKWGVAILSPLALTALTTIWFCIRALLDKDGSMNGLMKFGELFGEASIITLNFISIGLCFWGLWYLEKVDLSLGGEKLKVLRYQKIHKAKNPLGNTEEWCCPNCGYINKKIDLECKSCGKYR